MTGNIIGKGEGLILGGVIIFDSHGTIQYAFEESTSGNELPIDSIKQALQNVINKQQQEQPQQPSKY